MENGYTILTPLDRSAVLIVINNENGLPLTKSELKVFIEDLKDNYNSMPQSDGTPDGLMILTMSEMEEARKKVNDMELEIKKLHKELSGTEAVHQKNPEKMHQYKRLKKKYKAAKQELETVNNKLFELSDRTGKLIYELAQAEADNNTLRNEINGYKESHKIIYQGRPVWSEYLTKVVEERDKQLRNGRTIEKDVVCNQKGDLIKAALYCIDSNTNEYPESWSTDFKDKVDQAGEMRRLVYAAALLTAHMDMRHYIFTMNAKAADKDSQ